MKNTSLKILTTYNTGFTLINVIVALGISGILMVVLAQLMTNSANSQRYILQKQEAFTQHMAATGVLSDRTACETNFQNQGIPYSGVNTLVKEAATPIISVNDEFGRGLIRLENMELINFKPYTAGGPIGTAELSLEFKGLGSGIADRSFGQVIMLAVELNGALIKSCVAIGNDLDDIWRRHSSSNQLYYTGTYVGIGTDQPEEMLHVSGNILAQAFLYDSDINLKENIKEIEITEDFKHFRGVRFTWKNSGEKSIGVIAQEIEKVFPEVVHTSKRTGLKRVAYDQLIAPLIQYNNVLRQQMKDLENKQRDLEAQLKNKRKR